MSSTLLWNEMDSLRLILQQSRCRDEMRDEKREKFRTRKKIGAITYFSGGTTTLGQGIHLLF